MNPMAETPAEEAERLKREIGERQARLAHLVLGDQSKSVTLPAHFAYDGACTHQHWSFDQHGRRCTCGAWMVDFGD